MTSRFTSLTLGRCAAIGALVLGATSACDDPNELPRCGNVVEPCDITEARCQRAVFAATACARGQSGATRPPIRVISRDQLKREIATELAADVSTRDADALTRAYALLRLLPPPEALDDAYATALGDGIAAYYEDRHKRVTVVSDAAGSDADGTFVLAHEFVHALQDQREGLAAVQRKAATTDASVAIDALVEGEAVFLSNLALARIRDESLHGKDLGGYFQHMLERTLDGIAESEGPLILATQVLPYPLGGRGVWQAWQDDGLDGIHALYTPPRTELAAWLEGVITADEALACGVPSAPAGYELLDVDTLGVAGLVALGVGQGFDPESAFDRAGAWADDRIAVFANEARSEVALAWRIRLGQRPEPSHYFAVQPAELDGAADVGDLDDRELLLVAASDGSVLDSWTVAGACPKLDQPKARTTPLLVALRRAQGLMR